MLRTGGGTVVNMASRAGLTGVANLAAYVAGKAGITAEVADTVLWLCSDQASYITGIVVPIDGGQSAGVKPPSMRRQRS
jgi:NAD(P)-dependent dehydrogenase (short-subunit alcohol dehydrogenase family)